MMKLKGWMYKVIIFAVTLFVCLFVGKITGFPAMLPLLSLFMMCVSETYLLRHMFIDKPEQTPSASLLVYFLIAGLTAMVILI